MSHLPDDIGSSSFNFVEIIFLANVNNKQQNQLRQIETICNDGSD